MAGKSSPNAQIGLEHHLVPPRFRIRESVSFSKEMSKRSQVPPPGDTKVAPGPRSWIRASAGMKGMAATNPPKVLSRAQNQGCFVAALLAMTRNNKFPPVTNYLGPNSVLANTRGSWHHRKPSQGLHANSHCKHEEEQQDSQ